MSTNNELQELVSEWMHGGYTPNPGRPIVRELDQGAALTAVLVELQRRGADMSRWTPDEWEKVLTEEFALDPVYMSDYLEEIGSWGVVDDSLWPEE